MAERFDLTRRTVLHTLGIWMFIGFAGCATDSETRDLSGHVPKTYRTATDLDGTKRDPNSLTSKGDVNYRSDGSGTSKCSNCRYFIPDKNGDGHGACSLVEGEIEPAAWCSLYVQYQNGNE